MSFELNILNNPAGDCGGVNSTSTGCGDHGACGGCQEAPPERSRRDFLKRATTFAFGSFSLTLLPVSSGGTASQQASAVAGGASSARLEERRCRNRKSCLGFWSIRRNASVPESA